MYSMALDGLSWPSALLYLGFHRGIIDTVAEEFGIGYPPVLGLTLGVVYTGHQSIVDRY